MIKKIYTALIMTIMVSSVAFSQDSDNMRSKNKKKDKPDSFFGLFSFPHKGGKHHSGRPHKKKRHLMDTHTIFDFDKEVQIPLRKTKCYKKEFKKQNELLDVQIEYLETRLLTLLKQHKAGEEHSSEIVDTYQQLFTLCNQNYMLKQEHAEQLYKLFQATYKDYVDKTTKTLEQAKTNSDVLVNHLIQKYDQVYSK